jgi:hypothetical protein
MKIFITGVAGLNTANWIKNRGPKPFDYSFPLEIINDKTPQPWRDRLM